jgi:hypothetical protein
MIFSWLISKVGLYVIGGALIATLLGGGYWYVSHLRAENALQKVVIEQQQQAIEYYQKAAEIDVDTAKEKERLHEIIQSGDPQRVLDYFRRMRELSSDPEGEN